MVVILINRKEGEKNMQEAVETVAEEVVGAPTEVETPKSEWQEAGFLDELARVCDNLEHLEETSYLPAELNQIIERINSSNRVEEYDDLTDEQVLNLARKIRNDLPRFHQDVLAMIRDVSNVKTIIISDDFI